MLTRRSALVWSVSLLLGATACKGPAAPGEVQDQTVERRLEIEVGGDRTASFDGNASVHVVTRNGAREQVEFNVAAIELAEPIVMDDGQFAVEVGIVGLFTGEGSYTLPSGIGLVVPDTGPTVPAPLTGGGVTLSNISILFYGVDATGTIDSEERFAYLLEACTVDLSNDATTGSVHCPALVSFAGDQVSLDFSWHEA